MMKNNELHVREKKITCTCTSILHSLLSLFSLYLLYFQTIFNKFNQFRRERYETTPIPIRGRDPRLKEMTKSTKVIYKKILIITLEYLKLDLTIA